MLDMNETGMKITTRLSVVASTGSAISAVASRGGLERRHPLLLDEAEDVLQHDDGVVDDDADHQHQREHRHAVEREVERRHHAEGRDDRGREWRPPAMTVARQLRMKANTTRQARMLPSTRCTLISCSAA